MLAAQIPPLIAETRVDHAARPHPARHESFRRKGTLVSVPPASISSWNWGMLLRDWFGCRRVVSFVQWR